MENVIDFPTRVLIGYSKVMLSSTYSAEIGGSLIGSCLLEKHATDMMWVTVTTIYTQCSFF